MENGWKWFVAFAAGGFLAGTVAVFLYLLEFNEGYFDPVYDPDGGYVYFIKRQTVGVTWGLGIEFFTAPAQAMAFTDRVSLNRLEVATGRVRELEAWPSTPITRRRVQNYRGRVFQTLTARLRATAPCQVEYRVGMTVNRATRPGVFHLSGVWREGGGPGQRSERGEWTKAPIAMDGGGVSPLHGDSELIAVPGREAYPAAIVAYDHVKETNAVLLKNDEFDMLYGGGVPLDVTRSQSRRSAIERDQTIKRLKDRLVAGFEAVGQSALDAGQSAIEEMQRLGVYPRDATLTARRLDGDFDSGPDSNPDAPPLFDITEAEFKAGLFPDIAAAIGQPGEATDWRGDYAVRRDFDTGARLNAYLDAGNDVFRVRAQGRVFELTLDRQPQ